MLEMHSISLGKNSNYDYKLRLVLPSKKVISDISLDYVVSTDLKFNDTSSINLRIPKYIANNIGQRVENRLYELCTKDKLITLNEEFCFYIQDYNEEENGEFDCVKTLTCYSNEKKLEQRNYDFLNGMTRQIAKDEVNVSDGVLDFFVEDMYNAYEIGYLDEDAVYESINGGLSKKYRWFDGGSNTWLNLFRSIFPSAFKCLFLFDTYNDRISVYDEKNIGRNQGLYLSFDNFIRKINKKTNNSTIVTRLNVDGGSNQDTVDISTVNPTGKSYIENFDSVRNIMSEELRNALDKYNEIVEEKYIEWLEIKNEIVDLNSQINTINANLTSLSEALKPQNAFKAQYIKEGNNTLLTPVTNEINRLNGLINDNLANKSALTLQIDDLNEQVSDIADQLEKKTCKDENNNLVFSQDLLKELNKLIYESTYSNDYFLTSQGLFDDSVKQLEELQIPPVEFSVDSMSFIDAIKHPKGSWDKVMRLGDFVMVESKNFGLTKCRLIGIQHTPQKGSNAPSLQLTFSNKPYKFEELKLGSAVSKGVKAGRTLDGNGKKWNNYEVGVGFAENVRLNGLNLAAQKVQGASGTNRIDLSEFGQFFIDTTDDNNQLYLGSSLICLTTDKWLTSNVAIDESGVIADMLVGRVILGENLYITGKDEGLFEIRGNGLSIKDTNGALRVFLGIEEVGGVKKARLALYSADGSKTLLTEEGILQGYGNSVCDNVDQYNNLDIDLVIPSSAKSIYSLKLAISLQDYRTYEASTESGGTYLTSITSADGGGVVTTTAGGGGGTVTSGSSSKTSSDAIENITIFPDTNGAYITDMPANDPDTGMPKYGLHTHRYTNTTLFHSHGIEHNHNLVLGNHVHSLSINNHSHLININIPSHFHNLVYQIYKIQKATNVRVKIDGIDCGVQLNGDTVLDLTNIIDLSTLTAGFHKISISSTTLGRISATYFIEYFASV